MRVTEAKWIGGQLAELDERGISPLIELGSSTGLFRSQLQPHIDREIHAPLTARGVEVIHCDLKADEGVDVAGDIFDPEIQAALRKVGAHSILCCNMFEHVVDRARLAETCDALLAPGGFMIVTVPHSYPLHLDPIDSYYRPSPEQIAAMFPGYRLMAGGVISDTTYLADIIASGNYLRTFLRLAARIVLFRGRRDWVVRNHRLLWLFRPYKIAAVVLEKPKLQAAASQ